MTTAERLRNQGPIPSLIACRQAADELDRNQDTIAQLRAERDALARERDRMREALTELLEDFETWLLDHDVDLNTQSRLKTAHEALKGETK